MTSESPAGAKPPQTGLVDMGNPSFYDEPGTLPSFSTLELYPYSGSFSEIVLNVTWAELQPTENGPLDTSSINTAISEVETYNALFGTDVGIKLRVWGGYTAPTWAKNIDGPPMTVTGPGLVDPGSTAPETIGRFWTADYLNAWTGFQNELAATYDSNPIIRGISNTAGASASDEPFSQVYLQQMPELQAGGYNDAAEELTLRAGISDYSAWAATPVDYAMSVFRLEDADKAKPDPNFTLAVLQEAENSSRTVQAGNHALNNPLPSQQAFLYAQIATDAALNPASVPASYQTDYPANLGPYANWSNAISDGVATDAGDIELWDTPVLQGFESKSPASIAALATDLANGVAPVTGAPDNGQPLAFIAPAVVTATPGTIGFSGVDAVLLASATNASSYTVTVISAAGNTLTAVEDRTELSGASLTFSGSLGEVNTILASLADEVAAGSDTLTITATGGGNSVTETVGVVASANTSVAAASSAAASGAAPESGSGHSVTYTWTGQGPDNSFSDAANWAPSGGPPVSNDVAWFANNAAPATVSGSGAVQQFVVNRVVALDGAIAVGPTGPGDVNIANKQGTAGVLLVAGVDASLAIAGDLDVGGTATAAGGTGVLLAALTGGAYSSAALTVGGTLNVWSGGAVRMTGELSSASVKVGAGGVISGDGLLAPGASDPVVNSGTIEAVANQTLGLQQLTVDGPLSGTGQAVIDAGAELTLGAWAAAGQTVVFGAPTIEQLSNGPYSPTTLVLAAPDKFNGAISGFSFADALVLDGVDASGASYSGDVLTVQQAGGGGSLSFQLSGDLTGLQPLASTSGSGSAAVTTISFVAPPGGVVPSVTAPAILEATPGVAVPVPDIVVNAPFPAVTPADTDIVVSLATEGGTLGVATAADDAAVTQNDSQSLTLTGTLDAVERSLASLTYTGAAVGTDTIAVSVSDYAGSSGVTGLSGATMIGVINENAGQVYTWSSPAGGSFADAEQWTTNGVQAAGAPGGGDIASFGAGNYTVTGDGAVGELQVAGTVTFTGSISAQGIGSGSTALVLQNGGTITLDGGAVLTAAQTVLVGASGGGVLNVMGSALNLTGTQGGLQIGQNAGSAGSVFDLGEINDAGSLVVGAGGSGTLELLGVAASAYDSAAELGQGAGSSGTGLVNGGMWATSGTLIVGDAGAGSLTIDGAANGITGQVTAGNATIGNQAGSSGAINVAGGDLLVANETASSSELTVGAAGTGELALSDAANVTVGVALADLPNSNRVADTGSLIVGGAAGGSGVVSITSGASLEVDGSSFVGQSGAGAVEVGAGAGDTGLFAMTGTLAIGADGTVTLGGAGALVRASAVTVAQGGTLAGAGTLSGVGGGNDTVMLASIANDGTIAASGGSLLVYGAVSGSGTLMATSGSELTLQAGVATGQTLQFGQNAEVTLNDAGGFGATIEGFSASDTLTLGSMPAFQSGTATLGANNLLTVTEGSQTEQLQFDPGQNFSGDSFQLSADGSWGTSITLLDPSAPQFSYADTATGTEATVYGQEYTGPDAGLQAEYVDGSADNAVISAEESNAFIVAGTGTDAVVAASGNNVLATEGRAAWFVGGSGNDTFFAAASKTEASWTTIVDFHSGDDSILWGFIPGASSYSWSASNGAPGHQGLTLESMSAAGVPDYVTFAGLSTADLGHLSVSQGSIGGQDYLMVHNS